MHRACLEYSEVVAVLIENKVLSKDILTLKDNRVRELYLLYKSTNLDNNSFGYNFKLGLHSCSHGV